MLRRTHTAYFNTPRTVHCPSARRSISKLKMPNTESWKFQIPKFEKQKPIPNSTPHSFSTIPISGYFRILTSLSFILHHRIEYPYIGIRVIPSRGPAERPQCTVVDVRWMMRTQCIHPFTTSLTAGSSPRPRVRARCSLPFFRSSKKFRVSSFGVAVSKTNARTNERTNEGWQHDDGYTVSLAIVRWFVRFDSVRSFVRSSVRSKRTPSLAIIVEGRGSFNEACSCRVGPCQVRSGRWSGSGHRHTDMAWYSSSVVVRRCGHVG